MIARLSKEQRSAIAATQRSKNAERIANPPRVAHPLVREFFQLLSVSEHSLSSLARRMGWALNTLRATRAGRDPRLTEFVSGLNAIGYTLAIVPIEKGGVS